MASTGEAHGASIDLSMRRWMDQIGYSQHSHKSDDARSAGPNVELGPPDFHSQTSQSSHSDIADISLLTEEATGKTQPDRRRRAVCLGFLCLGILLLIGVAVGIAVAVAGRNSESIGLDLSKEQEGQEAPSSPAPTALSPVTQPVVSPVPETGAPLPDTEAPVIVVTDAPVTPITSEPSLPQPTANPSFLTTAPTSTPIKEIIRPLLLNGDEFDDPNSYQSQALRFLETSLIPQSKEEYKTFFALACLYSASYGVHNKRTLEDYPGQDLAGWVTTLNWMTDSSYCTWYGITCNNNGDVVGIELAQNRMYGILAPELQYLKDTLEVIDLFENQYLVAGGDIDTSWIAEMTNLRNLFFGRTSFESNGIPTFLGQLTALEEIDFSFTFFDGPIPEGTFESNTRLIYVEMGGNDYTTTIPSSIANHPSIEFLYLSEARFVNVSQTLDFLVGMTMLLETWSDFVVYDGSIPSGIGALPVLESLSLTFCSLTGTIPTELGKLNINFDRLWLYQNRLTGTIPEQLGWLGRLKYLNLEGNLLTGSMPGSICDMKSSLGIMEDLGADCDDVGQPWYVECSCCTCCGSAQCGDFI